MIILTKKVNSSEQTDISTIDDCLSQLFFLICILLPSVLRSYFKTFLSNKQL